jgi:hypothetical protein
MIFSENRYPLFGIMLCWSIILSENRYPLFGIMLCWGMIFPKTGIHPRIKSEGKLFGIMLYCGAACCPAATATGAVAKCGAGASPSAAISCCNCVSTRSTSPASLSGSATDKCSSAKR